MKLDPLFEPQSDRLMLSFDREAQKAIKRVANQIFPLLKGRDLATISKEFRIRPGENLFQGKNLLEKISSEKGNSVKTTGSEASLTLALLFWSADHCLDKGERCENFSQAILLLARVTPVDIFTPPLPPPEEVFTKRSTPSDVWRSYETVRSRNGIPSLFVEQTYQLWRHLYRIPHRPTALQRLIDSLDIECLLFRLTLKDLAKAEIGVRRHPNGKGN